MDAQYVAGHQHHRREYHFSSEALMRHVPLLGAFGAIWDDPPWERGQEYEARGCKYKYKSGPDGFKEEYKCDGGGPRYAGGRPRGAPAYGWRRKHPQHYEVTRSRTSASRLGRCNRDVIGAVLGAAAGGVIESQVGKGSGRTVATNGGTIAGVLIGGAIGRSMDQADQACTRRPWSRHRPSTRSRGAARTAGNTASYRWRVTRTARAHLPRLPHHRHHRAAPAGDSSYRLPAAGRELAASD